MPKGPAARVGDPHGHPLPPVLTGGGSPNVFIGGQPAWRALPAGAGAALRGPKAVADASIKTAEAATVAAMGTPGLPAAKAAEEATKTAAAASMGALVMSTAAAGSASAAAHGGTVDTHACSTPLPIPPHGPGVVIDGSATVMINGLPAARRGDTIVEAVGPPNSIAGGCPTVIIGG